MMEKAKRHEKIERFLEKIQPTKKVEKEDKMAMFFHDLKEAGIEEDEEELQFADQMRKLDELATRNEVLLLEAPKARRRAKVSDIEERSDAIINARKLRAKNNQKDLKGQEIIEEENKYFFDNNGFIQGFTAKEIQPKKSQKEENKTYYAGDAFKGYISLENKPKTDFSKEMKELDRIVNEGQIEKDVKNGMSRLDAIMKKAKMAAERVNNFKLERGIRKEMKDLDAIANQNQVDNDIKRGFTQLHKITNKAEINALKVNNFKIEKGIRKEMKDLDTIASEREVNANVQGGFVSINNMLKKAEKEALSRGAKERNKAVADSLRYLLAKNGRARVRKNESEVTLVK